MTWDVVPFESLYAVPSRSGLTKPKRVRGEGVKMVNMGELFANDRISDPPMERVPLTDRERERALLQTGDLLFARQSLVAEGAGKCSIVLAVPEPTTFESHLFRVRLAADRASPSFYYYYYASPQGKGNIQSLVIQVAAAGIRGSELARLPVPCPPLDVQHKIASILSAYDDLIENNLRRIQILEEMAQALYREWFVEFRFPGHEGAALVASEMGRVPSGWDVTTVDDTFEINGGGTPSKKQPEYWDGGSVIWYSPSDLTRAGSMFMDKSQSQITELGLKKSSARLFPPFSVMLTSRATVGVVAINTTPACTNQGFINCIPNDAFPVYVLYFWVRECTDTIVSMASGATFKEISKSVFKTIPLLKPPLPLVTQFQQTVEPLASQILNLQRRNAKSRDTRDLLLPRLISGEVDVSNFNIDVGEAA